MATTENDNDDFTVSEGRGPGYPAISLEKAIERVEEIKTAGVTKMPLPSAGFLKIWGYKSASGPARRQVAALKHYGLLDYVGTGQDRKIVLTDLARKIVLDKVPDSPARLSALKEAALKPPVFAKLLDQFPFGIGTDTGIETFLTLKCGFSEDSAQTVIGLFKDTIHYAGLDKADNMPLDSNIEEVEVMNTAPATPQAAATPLTIVGYGMPQASGENDIKVLLDGNRLRVSAYVDLKGLTRLKKILDANALLLEADVFE